MQESLDIAFFGSSLVSAYWNGAATYYRGITRTLHERGHRITFYEPDAYERQQHRDIEDPPYARVVVYPPTPEAAKEVLSGARSAHVVIKASGVGVLDEFLERGVLEERQPEQTVIFWDVDAPATLERVQQNPNDPFRALIPEYDMILTYGGGEPVVRAYTALGAQQCVPIYNALDPVTHYPVECEPRFAAKLAFLGNRLPDREQRVHEFFFQPAMRMPTDWFLLGGSGWDGNAPQDSNIHYVGHVYSRDHNALNATADAVLNICRNSMAQCGFSPPTRVFEAAGAGACIITDAWEGVELFLEPGRECLVAANGAEVVRHLHELDRTRARAIGQAARKRILREHTYAHRAEQVESLLRHGGRV